MKTKRLFLRTAFFRYNKSKSLFLFPFHNQEHILFEGEIAVFIAKYIGLLFLG